jgi:hypothetical protein
VWLDIAMNRALTATVLSISALGSASGRIEAQTPAVVQAPAKHSDASLYGGGDGLSPKTAVVIKSRGDVAGVRSEYSWIADHYPKSQRVRQALTAAHDDGKRYDMITIKTIDDRTVILWFDISAMFD